MRYNLNKILYFIYNNLLQSIGIYTILLLVVKKFRFNFSNNTWVFGSLMVKYFFCWKTITIVNVFIVFVKFLSWIVAIWVKLVRLIRKKGAQGFERDNYKIKINKKIGPWVLSLCVYIYIYMPENVVIGCVVAIYSVKEMMVVSIKKLMNIDSYNWFMLWKKLLEFSFPSFWFNDRNIDFLIFIIIKLVTESLNNKIGIPYFLPPSYPFSLHFSQFIKLSNCLFVCFFFFFFF